MREDIPFSALLCAAKHVFPSDNIPWHKSAAVKRENSFQTVISDIAFLLICLFTGIDIFCALLNATRIALATTISTGSLNFINI